MDENVRIPIYIESSYRVNRKRIQEAVRKTLSEQEIKGPVEVSVAIVGDRKMKALNKKYRNLDKTTDVLSFSQTEGSPSMMPEAFLLLGDVVVSYPQVILAASKEEKLVDEKIAELVEHGVKHLLGMHHDE